MTGMTRNVMMGVKTSNSVAVELIRVTEGRDTDALGERTRQ